MLAAKPDDLSSIPGIHRVRRENQSPKPSSGLHICITTCVLRNLTEPGEVAVPVTLALRRLKQEEHGHQANRGSIAKQRLSKQTSNAQLRWFSST